ncbi:hypothetical protein FB451DRAFT_1172917 [Mycena latifolia]|nr:hypothetical protein FB451DRAFT_1172917 [Mycena latifolia]
MPCVPLLPLILLHSAIFVRARSICAVGAGFLNRIGPETWGTVDRKKETDPKCRNSCMSVREIIATKIATRGTRSRELRGAIEDRRHKEFECGLDVETESRRWSRTPRPRLVSARAKDALCGSACDDPISRRLLFCLPTKRGWFADEIK